MPWSATMPRPRKAREAVEVGHGRLAQPPERARFHDETHQHRGGQEGICRQAARARDEPERRILHASAPVITVRPSRGDEDGGHSIPRRFHDRLLLPGEEERLREHLGLGGRATDDGHAQKVAVRKAARLPGR